MITFVNAPGTICSAKKWTWGIEPELAAWKVSTLNTVLSGASQHLIWFLNLKHDCSKTFLVRLCTKSPLHLLIFCSYIKYKICYFHCFFNLSEVHSSIVFAKNSIFWIRIYNRFGLWVLIAALKLSHRTIIDLNVVEMSLYYLCHSK